MLSSSFSFVSSLLMTAPGFDSEPVALIVSMSTTGSAPFAFVLSMTRSHGSPSYSAPAAMALDASTHEPPPIASSTSTWFSRQSFTPSRTELILGFGEIPGSSKIVKARRSLSALCPSLLEQLFPSSCMTLSYRPVRFILPPP